MGAVCANSPLASIACQLVAGPVARATTHDTPARGIENVVVNDFAGAGGCRTRSTPASLMISIFVIGNAHFTHTDPARFVLLVLYVSPMVLPSTSKWVKSG